VLLLYVALALYITCMVVIGVAALVGLDLLAPIALGAFLLGDGILPLGVLRTAIEIYKPNRALSYEIRRVLNLGCADPHADRR
jgi:hypothetical protein